MEGALKNLLPLMKRGRFGFHFQILSLRPEAYGVDELAGIGVHPESAFAGLTSGASIKGYPSPLEDPSLRREAALGITPGIDIIHERPSSLRKVDGLPGAATESNVLFVDGLPNDCSRREVGRILFFSLIFSATSQCFDCVVNFRQFLLPERCGVL